MFEARKWSLVGYGNIGQELARQVEQPAVAERLGLNPLPNYILRKSGIYEPFVDREGNKLLMETDFESFDELEDPGEAVFVAMPSEANGEAAYEIISDALGKGINVVTAEKGAMANFFPELRQESEDFRFLGINATVGGGTRIMDAAKILLPDRYNVSQIHLALNGTLTYIMSSMAPKEGGGLSLGQAVFEAKTLGYAEPDAVSPYDVIRSEATGDIPKKTSIFFNTVGLSEEPLDWHSLQFEISDEEISQVVQEARIRRFIVSILKEDSPDLNNDRISGSSVLHDGWRIVSGFQHTDRNPLLSPLGNLTGPMNGGMVGLGPDETDGSYPFGMGPGAGPRPTVNAMLDDYITISQQSAA